MFTFLSLFLAKKNDLIRRVVQALFCVPGAQMPIWRLPSRAMWTQHLPGLGVWLGASMVGGIRNCWTSPRALAAAPRPLPSHHVTTAEAELSQMESAHRLDLASSWNGLTS